jgi:hypothetical protein
LRRGVFADVDGDGDLDLLAGEGSDRPSATWSGPIRQYENRAGSFADVTAQRMPTGNWLNGPLVAFDHDRDGDLDLIASPKYSTAPLVFDNDGRGTFTLASAVRLPGNLPPVAATSIGAADIDRDGDLDVVLAGRMASSNDVYLRNDGTGRFTDATSSLPSDPEAVLAVLDLDRDGDADIVKATQVYVNDGAGAFAARALGVTLPTWYEVGVQAADLDGDGRLDLLATATQGADHLPHIFVAQANGTFVARPAFLPEELRAEQAANNPSYWVGAAPLVVLDLDGDGRPDLVRGGWKGYHGGGSWTVGLAPKALLNRDGVEFRDGSRSPLPRLENDGGGVHPADLDGDGDVDFVLGQDRDRVLRNRGDGTFALAEELPGLPGSPGGMVADFDGDGDLDFVRTAADLDVPRAGPPSLVLRQGSGWVLRTVPAVPAQVEGFAAGDVDGDGDLDLVLGCFDLVGAQTRLWLNDGRAQFTDATAARMPSELQETARVYLRDVDGDGDLDLIELALLVPQDRVRLSLNDGTGRFTDVSGARLPPLSPRSLAVVDLDHDGDADLVVPGTTLHNDGTGRFTAQANAFTPFDHLVELDGPGTWTTVRGDLGGVTVGATGYSWGANSWHATAPVDVDRDGDLDVVVVPRLQFSPYHFHLIPGVLFNLTRQLHAPKLLRLGQGWTLSLRAAALNSFGVGLLATAQLSPRFPLPPLGMLGVDPVNGLPWTAAAGTPQQPNDVTFRVPADASLVDVPLHAQVLLVPSGNLAQARLTGMVSDRITR